MADLNTTYTGYVEFIDPDVKLPLKCKGVMTPFGCIGGYEDVFAYPDDLRESFRALNAQSASTVEQVKVAYSVDQQRVAWLNERIAAIGKRVEFVRERIEPFRQVLIENGELDANEKLNVTLTKIVPVLGPIAGTILQKAIEQDKAASLSIAKQKLQYYSEDLEQLTTIRTQLLSELAKTNTTTDPTNEAPSVPTWYYVVGIGLLLLFFVWLRRRNQKRRKR